MDTGSWLWSCDLKLWGGRFTRPTDEVAHAYQASIGFDRRLVDVDIEGSRAWARALRRAGVLSSEEAAALDGGLSTLATEASAGVFEFLDADEDVHTAVERRLGEILGDLAGKLHAGRSRNDQVATDLRMWTMRACRALDHEVRSLQAALLASAEAGLDLPMPGYTHLQPAQVVTWGHWALSHFWPLARDRARLAETRKRASALPLGSAALAGTGFAIDRLALARDLGFHSVSPNSIDAVADRDFGADFLFASTMVGIHLSRLSEQLILFANPAFGFVVIGDDYATGSSLMPQKRNPDTLELTRGKAGRLIGNLTGLLATLKALPSAYDKDLQEDKEPLFDAFDTLSGALPVMAGLIAGLETKQERMVAALDPAMWATDLADHLVRQGVPFREAHSIAGAAVRHAEELGVTLADLEAEELRLVDPRLDEGARSVFSWRKSLASRAAIGGTAPDALAEQLEAARRAID